MTEKDARDLLIAALATLKIGKGDTVFLGIDMGGLPLPAYPTDLTRQGIRKREDAWCDFVFRTLMDAVGHDGTLLAPAFTYDYARNGTPYEHETSPAETGPFCEYFRRLPGVLRSLHPLNSICGIGPDASAILEGVGKSGYGSFSPFARLGTYGTRFLFLGTDLGRALTYAHHMEHMYGVNHMYHKLYNTPVTRGGQEIGGPWLCFVRYLGVEIEPRIGNLEDELRREGRLLEFADWSHPMQSAALQDIEQTGYRMLNEDPCAFLSGPVEIHIDAPGAAIQETRHRAFSFAKTR